MQTVHDFAIQFGMEVFPLVMIWTVLALFMMLILRIIPNLHPVLHYHTHSAIVLALPIGIVFGTLFSIPVISSSALAPVSSFLPLFESDPIIISSIGDNESQMAQSSFQITLVGVLSAMFLVSIIFGLTRLILIYIRLQHAIKHASPIQDQSVLEIAEEIRSSLGIKRLVRLKTMPGAIVPFTTGHFSPLVVLPEDYTKEENQLRFIITHELIHVSRFDYVLHTLEVVVRHIFWMHPLVHVLYRQTSYWREVSCDVEVLKTAGNHTETYAKILYEFALKTQEKPIFRAAMAEESHLLRRIRAFTNQTINTKEITMKKSILIAGVLLLVLGGIMACSDMTNNPKVAENKIDMSQLDAIKSINEDGEVVYRIGNMDFSEELFNSMTLNLFNSIKSELEKQEAKGTDPNNEPIPSMRLLSEKVKEIRSFVETNNFDIAVLLYNEMMSSNQPKIGDKVSEDTFAVVERMPEMIGGQMAFYNVLRYPDEARENGSEGRVIVQFVVDESGNVINPIVVRSSGLNSLDQAATDAIKKVTFEPGMQDGQPVKVQMTQPVIFRLN